MLKKTKTVRFIDAIAGRDASGIIYNYNFGQVVDLSKAAAKIYIDAGIAVSADETEKLKLQVTGAAGVTNALVGEKAVADTKLQKLGDEKTQLAYELSLAKNKNSTYETVVESLQAKLSDFEEKNTNLAAQLHEKTRLCETAVARCGDFEARQKPLEVQLVECKEELDQVIGLLDEANEEKRQIRELSSVVSGGNMLLHEENDGLRKQIAGMLNGPVVTGVDLGEGDKTVYAAVDENGKVKLVVEVDNAETNLGNVGAAPDKNTGGQQVADENAGDGGKAESDGADLTDRQNKKAAVGETADESAGVGEAETVVTPPVVTGADGKRTKKLPGKGGKKGGK